MKHVFWIVPNVLAGRPGPNFEPWDERELFDGGIRAVLSVNSGDDVYTSRLQAVGIDYRCLPLSANAPPVPGDDEICRVRLAEQYAFVSAHMAEQNPVLVHCRHGKDRTGMFLAYFLMKQHELDPEAAISQLRDLRPNALTADGWYDLAVTVLGQLQTD